MEQADSACYAAKERGRNRVHFYEPNDVLLAVRQGEMQWVSRITSALEEQRFRLYGQVIAPLVSRPNEPPRLEVLLRLIERDGSIIAPGGIGGPAFLLTSNFNVILRYNNAENYALGVGHLSDRLAGGGPLSAAFGPDANGLTKADRQELQRLLTAKGFDTGGSDGVMGAKTKA